MKVSILSMQRIINCGSFLQAYGLKKILEELNFQIEFIDIKDGEYHGEKFIYQEPFLKSKMEFLKNKNKLKYVLNKIKYKLFERDLKRFQKIYLHLNKHLVFNPSVDSKCTIIGSDEVFNCDPFCSWGISSQLFGNIKTNRVISYAASCGFMTYNKLPPEGEKILKESLKNMYSISVRDANTYDFIKKLTNKQIEYNLDPVLIYSFNEEMNNLRINRKLKNNFLLIYSYENRIEDKNLIFKINDFASQRKLRTYCVGAPLYWCDEYLLLNPFEILMAFKNAKYVITDTFHGAILASKFNKQFLCLIREDNKNKLEDLLRRLKLEDAKIDSTDDVNKKFSIPLNYNYFNRYIKEERQKTIEYLKRNLEGI